MYTKERIKTSDNYFHAWTAFRGSALAAAESRSLADLELTPLPVLRESRSLRASCNARSSSYSRSNKPRLSGDGTLFHFTSGIPSGGKTMLMTSEIKRYLRMRSVVVVEVNDGDAFTSISHGFKLSSIKQS